MQAEKLCEIFAEPLQVMQVLISSVGGALIAQMFGISFGNRVNCDASIQIMCHTKTKLWLPDYHPDYFVYIGFQGGPV